ncbi:MAG: pentapeptide repeat-containing protein [Bacteriovoracia bacterium]
MKDKRVYFGRMGACILFFFGGVTTAGADDPGSFAYIRVAKNSMEPRQLVCDNQVVMTAIPTVMPGVGVVVNCPTGYMSNGVCTCQIRENVCKRGNTIGLNAATLGICGESLNANRTGTTVSAGDFSGARWVNTNFNSAAGRPTQLKNAKLSDTYIYGSTFSGADLSGLQWFGNKNRVVYSDFTNANLSGMKALLGDVSFGARASYLQGYQIVNYIYGHSNFNGAKFNQAYFSGRADFWGGTLNGADFSGVYAKDGIAFHLANASDLIARGLQAEMQVDASNLNRMDATGAQRAIYINASYVTGLKAVGMGRDSRPKGSDPLNSGLAEEESRLGDVVTEDKKSADAYIGLHLYSWSQLSSNVGSLVGADVRASHLDMLYLSGYVQSSNFSGSHIDDLQILDGGAGAYMYLVNMRNLEVRQMTVSEQLYSTELNGSRFEKVTILDRANFATVNFSDVKFGEATVGQVQNCAQAAGVSFPGSIFNAGTDLRQAKLGKVDLSGAPTFGQAQLTGARYTSCTVFPAGFNPQAKGMILQ